MIEDTSFQGFHVVSFCFILFHVSFPQRIPALCAAKAANFPRVLSHPHVGVEQGVEQAGG